MLPDRVEGTVSIKMKEVGYVVKYIDQQLS